jgi:hypothetical protein
MARVEQIGNQIARLGVAHLLVVDKEALEESLA